MLDVNIEADGESSESSDESSMIPETNPIALVDCRQKIVPVMRDLKYSGDNSGLSLNAFLERVEELMVARSVTREQVFRSAID